MGDIMLSGCNMDLYREKVLESMGYHVMRFTNEEVVEDIDRVLTEIKHYFDYGE